MGSIRKRPNQGDRNTKHGRGGRAPARDGKRAYDRRSGTGRGKETKKGGGGARNWGSDKNEARQNEGHVEEGAEAPADAKDPVGDDTERNEEPAVEEEPEPEPEPEDNTMSYEEYMASKADPDNAAFAPVKEREVEDQFSGLKLAKKEEVEEFMVMGGGKQKKPKQKKNNTKTTLTPAFRVKRSDDGERREGGRGRGGRDGRGRGGGRGGGRDGRGRGGGRDGRGRGGGRGGGREGGRGGGREGRGRGGGGRGGGGLNLGDASAFPSL